MSIKVCKPCLPQGIYAQELTDFVAWQEPCASCDRVMPRSKLFSVYLSLEDIRREKWLQTYRNGPEER